MGYPPPQLDDNGDGISNTDSDGQVGNQMINLKKNSGWSPCKRSFNKWWTI